MRRKIDGKSMVFPDGGQREIKGNEVVELVQGVEDRTKTVKEEDIDNNFDPMRYKQQLHQCHSQVSQLNNGHHCRS